MCFSIETQNLKAKYSEFEPHLDDILIYLKKNLTEALTNKVRKKTSLKFFQ